MHVGTGFVGAGDTLATDCSTLKHRRGAHSLGGQQLPRALLPRNRAILAVSPGIGQLPLIRPLVFNPLACASPSRGRARSWRACCSSASSRVRPWNWACGQVVDGLFMRLLSRPLGVVRIRWGICRPGWCGCDGGCRSLRSRCRPRCRPGRGRWNPPPYRVVPRSLWLTPARPQPG